MDGSKIPWGPNHWDLKDAANNGVNSEPQLVSLPDF